MVLDTFDAQAHDVCLVTSAVLLPGRTRAVDRHSAVRSTGSTNATTKAIQRWVPINELVKKRLWFSNLARWPRAVIAFVGLVPATHTDAYHYPPPSSETSTLLPLTLLSILPLLALTEATQKSAAMPSSISYSLSSS